MFQRLLTISTISILFFCNNSFSQDNSVVRKKEFNVSGSALAIDGYDPVAYFSLSKAIKGNKDYSTVYQGVAYYFSSVANRDEFKKNPAKYEPQYGGWCAYAMGAKGEKVEVDPETFKVVNGKLYLFYNKYFNNTLNTWNKDESNLRQHADQNWLRYFH
jgi:YHS domain-containing protein